MTNECRKLTREEFYEKYGDEKVMFNDYFKCVFSFYAQLPDGRILNCQVGGNLESIYEFHVDRQMRVRLRDLEPFAGSIYGEGGEGDHFYD